MLLALIAAAAVVQIEPGTNPVTDNRLDQRPPTPTTAPPADQPRASVQTAGSETPIQTIVFQGIEAPNRVAEAAAAFIGRPATRETLVELAGALSLAYERTDIALYTVIIPDQNFTDGVVVVELVEGWIDAASVKAAEGTRFDLLEARANRLIGEKPLSRRRFERQSALMQSIPGLKLDATFENPEGDDSVKLVLTPRQERVEGALGINNRGPHLLGNTIVQGGLDFYKLLTDGDQLSLSGYATYDFRHYRAIDGTYAIPIGADGLTLSATAGWLRTKARQVNIRGTAKFAGLTLTYSVLRRARHAADISFGIDGVNSNNALFGNVFATERSRAARLAAAFVAASEADNLEMSAAISKGLDALGARAGDTAADLDFTKFNAAAAYERTVAARLIGRMTVAGQFSRSRLPAAELWSVGGASIGRAFDTGILTGDRGVGGFAELAYRPIDRGAFEKSEAYVFADAATLRVNRRPTTPQQSFSLASAGAGVRATYKDRMQLGVEGAVVLDKPFAEYSKNFRLSVYYSVLF